MRQIGVTRAASIEEAYEAAATFATQPLPTGPNVAVLTTAGGWGVVTADAITATRGLSLMELPADLMSTIDPLLPPRWSRNNPVDFAGGEGRDTIVEVMTAVAAHRDVHAIVYLGIGIQSNTARMMRTGGFFADHELARICDYHERQDQRFAVAAAELSSRYNKPILTATELTFADPNNAGPAAVRASGRVAYGSGNRAVTALGHLWRRAQFLQRHPAASATHLG
jgi:acetyltransferase